MRTILVAMLLWAAQGTAGERPPEPRAAAEPCSGQRGFDRGRAGLQRAAHCSAEDYAAAWRLGSELAALLAERARLAQGQAERAAAERHAVARRMRQLEVDVEAIRGVLQLRGIVLEGPVVEAGAPVADGGAQ